ncbi:hypothetical protein DDB_G0276113 [Dictyostelium discoideum AX4]|uniref:Cathepsin propeptide inhibitor domain-containing protein n=1 Tax=Dictyostelium discoideum TaxID=44689 RepID=Q75JG9_DICDI|nr:hypothetical protein DDB_G0276113 [Dictyostelium discoideum AX4]EAL69356.1 hypothetical protein DDB_G0276113 [Dictyostelium discoideum AX4]|eukprot:XP_643260.1 hypothetical protein DDB_G0276113 [Dictyostelium discoideum AX4]
MIKLLLILFFIFPSLINSNEINDKYWPVFNSWMDAYDVKYHSSVINEKFENFKENCIQIQNSNNKNVKFVTVTFEDDIQNSFIESSFGRKLQSINDVILPSISITLPSSNIPTLSLNKFSDLSHGEFIDMFTGQNEGVESIPDESPSLSDGAISGIVICSFIGCSALVGSAIYLIKRRIQTKEKEVEKQNEIKEIEDHIKKVFGGVNVFDLQPGSHQSITARGYPIEMVDIKINNQQQ